jgi:hypothetical protein
MGEDGDLPTCGGVRYDSRMKMDKGGRVRSPHRRKLVKDWVTGMQ